MARKTRPFWFPVISSVLCSVALAWAGAQTAPASTPTKPKGTVTVAFHTFSKEVMDPSLDGTPGLPYHGQMFDWLIGATPDGKLTTAYGALERYESNADANLPAAFGPLEGDLQVLPKHYYGKVRAQGFEDKPLGSGPWKVEHSSPRPSPGGRGSISRSFGATAIGR